MKSIAKAILVGGFMLAAQASVAADSVYPMGSEQFWDMAPHSAAVTRADNLPVAPLKSVGDSDFPQGTVQYWDIPPHSYYSDTHPVVAIPGREFPLGSEQFWDQSPHNTATTRADQFVNNPTQLSQSPAIDDASSK